MSWIQVRVSRIRTTKAEDAITYARLMKVGSIAYGTLVNVMIEREGSAERVVELLRRAGTPRRLDGTDTALRMKGD
jgi:phage replication initiation protein